MLTCFIDEALSLLLHPFLIVIFHIFFVLSAAAVGLPHRWLKQQQKTLQDIEREQNTSLITTFFHPYRGESTKRENLPNRELGRCRSSHNKTCLSNL